MVDIELRQKLGELILRSRQERCMKQKELAQELGFSAQFLGHVERGAATMPELAFQKAIEVLELDVEAVKSIFIYCAIAKAERLTEPYVAKVKRKKLSRRKNVKIVK